MKNTNDLKVFVLAPYGTGTVASKGGGGTYMGNDGTAYTPGINPGGESQYSEATGINPGGMYNKGALSTTIQVIDVNGNPLESAHLRWNENGSSKGTITDANGDATINVANENTIITISYLGKRAHVAAFKDLVNAMITLQENVNSLPPVVVKPTPKPTTKSPTATTTEVKKNNLVKTAAIGIGALLLLGALSKGKKGKGGLNGPEGLNGGKAKKKKKAKKGKKSKGLRQPVEITL